ncbi:DUF4056 domain-containing protein [Neptunomonas phycophila]|uniref:DUF4056 domain-containing protein n=1 Tax=Neptunomonas phycophila TaxID=1572645 RepID=UPI000948FF10|nr:DUF4056 domain-containing protein [Neptunomonas phycophila]
MSKRHHIIDNNNLANKRFGLIYTKKCGWIDLGHAYPDSASKLWESILNERSQHNDSSSQNNFTVEYSQSMGSKKYNANTFVGKRKKFEIQKGLSLDIKKSIALSIILKVSLEFETMQSNWFYSLITDSGFSSEDLISNIIGVYRAIYPTINFLEICQPVSKSESTYIWDKFGAVGALKNRTLSPYLYPLQDESTTYPRKSVLPAILNTIKPTQEGSYFNEVR